MCCNPGWCPKWPPPRSPSHAPLTPPSDWRGFGEQIESETKKSRSSDRAHQTRTNNSSLLWGRDGTWLSRPVPPLTRSWSHVSPAEGVRAQWQGPQLTIIRVCGVIVSDRLLRTDTLALLHRLKLWTWRLQKSQLLPPALKHLALQSTKYKTLLLYIAAFCERWVETGWGQKTSR